MHKGEFVFSAPSVKALGLARLENLHRSSRGYVDGGLVVGPSSAGISSGRRQRGGQALSIIAVDSHREAAHIRRNSTLDDQIVELVKSRRHELYV